MFLKGHIRLALDMIELCLGSTQSRWWHGKKGKQKINMNNTFKLCYISGNCAYFTCEELSKVSSNGWYKVPYEHNASEPYNDSDPDTIIRVYFEHDYAMTPDYGVCNSSYSVDMINAKQVPWLKLENEDIFAGTSLNEFISVIINDGGSIYVKLNVRQK